ncbi:MAG: hypothetical protein ACPGAP_09715, partial [Akkermansiaceae bacterium]
MFRIALITTLGLLPLAGQNLPKLAPLPVIEELDQAELEASIRRGVDYLLAKQNKDGSWGSATRTKGLNIYAPVPDSHLAFRSGASMLALAGLLDSGDRRPQVIAAIDRAEAWMLKKLPSLKNVDPTTAYNNWGHAYALRAMVRLFYYRKDDEARRSQFKNLAA